MDREHFQDLADRAMRMAMGIAMPDDACAGLSQEDVETVMALMRYSIQWIKRRARGEPYRRGARLLKSLLTDDQRAQWRRMGDFHVTGSLGGLYRLRPRCGVVERIELHRTKFFARVAYCYHEADEHEPLPSPDRSLAHLVMLTTDEGRFLREANATVRDTLWSGQWMRAVRRGRQLRAAPPTAATAVEAEWLNDPDYAAEVVWCHVEREVA